MTITARVQQQFFSAPSAAPEALIRLPPTVVTNYAAMGDQVNRPRRASRPRRRTNLWTVEEHERFLRGLEQFPQGPWKEIAAMVGTKTTRQTMTHAQKYRQKIERRQRSGAPTEVLATPFRAVQPVKEEPHENLNEFGSDNELAMLSSEGMMLEASSPIDVGGDFFDPTLFDCDLRSLMEDLEPSSMIVPLSYSCIV